MEDVLVVAGTLEGDVDQAPSVEREVALHGVPDGCGDARRSLFGLIGSKMMRLDPVQKSKATFVDRQEVPQWTGPLRRVYRTGRQKAPQTEGDLRG